MANMQKYAKASLVNLVRHFERNEGIEEYKNYNINRDLSDNNYNLAPERENQLEFIKQRCSEVKCLKRADVKVMCTWAVTLPKDIEKDSAEEKQFFEETYKFLENRYGGSENVVSAYVHKDEKTPHMHFAFVPVKYDEKKQIYKVSAKEVINRNDLKTFHNDLNAHLKAKLGREVQILNETTKEGNKSVQELKNGTAIEELNKIKEDLKQYREIDTKIRDLDKINITKPKLAHKDKLLIDKDDLYSLIDDSKRLNALKKDKFDFDKINKKLEELTWRLEQSRNINKDFEKENETLINQVKSLEKEKNILSETLSRDRLLVQKTAKKLGEEAQKEFVEKFNETKIEMNSPSPKVSKSFSIID